MSIIFLFQLQGARRTGPSTVELIWWSDAPNVRRRQMFQLVMFPWKRHLPVVLMVIHQSPKVREMKCITILSVSAVHRPFYISICISTLPTQHTTFISIFYQVTFRRQHRVSVVINELLIWDRHFQILNVPPSPHISSYVDVHVDVDVDMDTDNQEIEISDHREEDVVRCLCKDFEDSGFMIQVQTVAKVI